MAKGGIKVYDLQGWMAETWIGTGAWMGEEGIEIVEAKTWY
jgi:hypothetical protein